MSVAEVEQMIVDYLTSNLDEDMLRDIETYTDLMRHFDEETQEEVKDQVWDTLLSRIDWRSIIDQIHDYAGSEPEQEESD